MQPKPHNETSGRTGITIQSHSALITRKQSIWLTHESYPVIVRMLTIMKERGKLWVFESQLYSLVFPSSLTFSTDRNCLSYEDLVFEFVQALEAILNWRNISRHPLFCHQAKSTQKSSKWPRSSSSFTPYVQCHCFKNVRWRIGTHS